MHTKQILVTQSFVCFLLLGRAGSAHEADTGNPHQPAEPSRETASDTLADAREEYDKNYIWFKTRLRSTSEQRLRPSDAVRGKFGYPVGEHEFYHIVGEPELAERYRRRLIVQGSAAVGSAIAAATGGILFLAGAMGRDRGIEADRSFTPTMTVGLLLMFAGAGGGVFAWLFDPHPIEHAEMRRLADQHNDQLRQDLGLGQQAER